MKAPELRPKRHTALDLRRSGRADDGQVPRSDRLVRHDQGTRAAIARLLARRAYGRSAGRLHRGRSLTTRDRRSGLGSFPAVGGVRARSGPGVTCWRPRGAGRLRGQALRRLGLGRPHRKAPRPELTGRRLPPALTPSLELGCATADNRPGAAVGRRCDCGVGFARKRPPFATRPQRARHHVLRFSLKDGSSCGDLSIARWWLGRSRGRRPVGCFISFRRT